MGVALEVRQLGHNYCRKGGKQNRRQQFRRMVAFAEFCAESGAHSMGQVGNRHVIRYWRSMRHLSDSTLYNHWRALCILWQLAGKPGKPPKPNKTPSPCAEDTSPL